MTRQRLPFPVSPQADESLPGFLLRTADNNFLRSPMALMQGAGWARLDIPPSERVLDELARLTECSTAQLSELFGTTFRNEKHHFLLREGKDWILRDRFVRSPHLPCCPHCLAERSSLRKAWELSPYTVCPRHRVQLIDRCSDCNAELVFDRPGITRCACGADLRSLPAEAGDETSRRLALAIDAHLQNELTEGGTLRRLFALGLDMAFRTLWLCGLYAQFFGAKHRDKGRVALEDMVVRQGMAALDDGATACANAIEECLAAPASSHLHGGPIACVVDYLFGNAHTQPEVEQAIRVLWNAAERSQHAKPGGNQLSLEF